MAHVSGTGSGSTPEYSAALTAPDRLIVESANRFLADGVALKTWWERSEATLRESGFDLVSTFRRPEQSRGFFGNAPLPGRTLPVMGVVDTVFYDRPKADTEFQTAAARWMRDQIREFVLHYFMRISDFRLPEELVASPSPQTANPDIQRKGMGFTQAFYRLRETGEIGKFPDDEASAIIDLREIGTVYEWLIVKLRVHDFSVSIKPFGSNAAQMMIPLREEGYLILTPDFILNQDDPEPGILGRYGLGYAFIKNPTRGMFAYGPGEFEAAFQVIQFEVAENGETTTRMAFVSEQPEKVMNLTIDPVDLSLTLANVMSFGLTSRMLSPLKTALSEWAAKTPNLDPTLASIDLLNQVTHGEAAKRLAISKEQMFKGFLAKHSMQHYQTLLGSVRTWRQIPDWLDESALPEWVMTGASS